MNFIDVFLLAGIAGAGYLGYRGGLAKKLFNLLMLIVAILLATKFAGPIAQIFLDAGMLEDAAAYVVGFGIVVLAVVIPSILLYRKFGKSKMGKSWSTAAGATLGVIEGIMIMSFILLGLKILDIPDNGTRSGSLLYRPMVNFIPKTFDLLQSRLPGATEFKEELSRRFKEPSGAGSPRQEKSL